jgi:cytidine deaminase
MIVCVRWPPATICRVSELTAEDADLYQQAQAAVEFAYVPYSRFAVGAALRTTDGEVITGANVENASYGMTMCAERNAVFSAVASGKRTFDAIAVYADADSVPPCGACRQVMAEFAPRLRVIFRRGGKPAVMTLDELLPEQFEL